MEIDFLNDWFTPLRLDLARCTVSISLMVLEDSGSWKVAEFLCFIDKVFGFIDRFALCEILTERQFVECGQFELDKSLFLTASFPMVCEKKTHQ